MVRVRVVIKINDIFIIVVSSNHFVKNLDSGGIPAKLAIIISKIHFFMPVLPSIFNTFILKFFSKYIIMITDAQ